MNTDDDCCDHTFLLHTGECYLQGEVQGDHVEIIMGLLVIIGVYIITMAEILYLNGIILGILSALFSSLFSVLNGKLVKKYSPVNISFYEFLTGLVFITLYLVIFNLQLKGVPLTLL